MPHFRAPFTLMFVVVMVTANWLAGTVIGLLPPQVLSAWGISHHSILNGDVFRLVTGTFLSHNTGMFLRQLCFAIVVIGTYEWKEGTWRAIVVFFTIDVLGTLLVLFGILPLLAGPALVIGEAELLTHDVGMSAGGFGLIGGLVAKQNRNWLLLALALIALFVKIGIAFEPIPDTAHILCLLLGFAFQSLLTARWTSATQEL